MYLNKDVIQTQTIYSLHSTLVNYTIFNPIILFFFLFQKLAQPECYNLRLRDKSKEESCIRFI